MDITSSMLQAGYAPSSFASLAEAAINTFTGATANDEEIAKLVKEAESQNSSFTCIVCMVCDE